MCRYFFSFFLLEISLRWLLLAKIDEVHGNLPQKDPLNRAKIKHACSAFFVFSVPIFWEFSKISFKTSTPRNDVRLFPESWPRHNFSKMLLAGLFKAKLVVCQTVACSFTGGTQRFASLLRNVPFSWGNSLPMGSMKLRHRLWYPARH